MRAILAEREENGQFADIFDFMERMSGIVNRKAFESLLHAGAFDSFGICRKQFMLPCKNGDVFIDQLQKLGVKYNVIKNRKNIKKRKTLLKKQKNLHPAV